jgi:uncharacterized membrane protein SpoIIM required for sporulation
MGKDKLYERFEALVDAADRRPIGFAELRELAQLYRAHSAQLSLERTRSSDPEAIQYLNALCLRAYAHVYATPRSARSNAVFWLRELPAVLGRTLALQLVATALLSIGALIGARLALEDQANLGAVVPGAMYPAGALDELWASASARAAFLERRDETMFVDTIFAGSLFTNNTRVGVLSLATGMLAGVPTVLLLIYNGLTLGGFAAIFMRGPEWLTFLAWIVPHAIPELLAIVLCSAGGLRLGTAVIAPGRAGRASALRGASSDALALLVSSIPLFVVAALIESFVRQSLMSTEARFGVALAAVAALVAYALWARTHGRRARAVDVSFLSAQR